MDGGSERNNRSKKRVNGDGDYEKPCYWLFLRLGRGAGLTVPDMDEMTPAMVLDAAVYEINALTTHTERVYTRNATQADYDAFAGW